MLFGEPFCILHKHVSCIVTKVGVANNPERMSLKYEGLQTSNIRCSFRTSFWLSKSFNYSKIEAAILVQL